jgi:outer membrane biosynthesis protein TonB
MFIRKALPWMASLLFHCGFLLVPVSLRNNGEGQSPGRFVNLTFDQGGVKRAASTTMTPKKEASAALPAPGDSAVMAANSPMSPEAQSPAVESASTDREEAAAGPEPPFGAQGSVPGGVTEVIGWQGSARGIVLRQAFPFPKVLSAAGQQADCAARITVTPLGMVVKVEIIQSSGYTEIDTRVEAALRGYLFSREYGPDKKNTIGIVRFRFRLEKLD